MTRTIRFLLIALTTGVVGLSIGCSSGDTGKKPVAPTSKPEVDKPKGAPTPPPPSP